VTEYPNGIEHDYEAALLRIRELDAALRKIAVGLLPDDGAAGHQQRYELCASRLCAIARDAIRSTSSDGVKHG